jgi:membrane-associated phospholipid phosphatase
MPRSPRFLVALAAGCVAVFGALLALAYWVPGAEWLDGAALDGFGALQGHGLDGIATTIAHSFNPFPYAIVAIGVMAFAFLKRDARTAAAATLILVGANVSSQVLKPLLAHPREFVYSNGHVSDVAGAAYPSGHATAAMSLALAVLLVAPRARRPLVATLGALVTIAVSFSIVMLGWHFPSDIVGGYLVATVWCLLPVAALRAVNARWPERGTVREAAREAMPTAAPSPAAIARVALAVTALASLVAAGKADALAGFAERHTAFVAVACAIAVSAAVLLAAVASISNSPRSSR